MANKVRTDFTIVTSGTAPSDTQTLGALTGVAGTHRLAIARTGANGTKRFVLTAASQANAGCAAFIRLPAIDVAASHGELLLRSNLAIDTYYKARTRENDYVISKVIASVETILGTVVHGTIQNHIIEYRFIALGTTLQLETKNLSLAEGVFTKQLELIDASIPGAGAPGFGANMLDSDSKVIDFDNWRWFGT